MSEISIATLQFLVWSVPGLFVAAYLLGRLRDGGSRVPTGFFGLPDLLVAFFLSGFFGLLVILQGLHPDSAQGGGETKITTDALTGGALFFLALSGLLIGFMKLRKISVNTQFGLQELPWWRALLYGLLLLLAVGPLLFTMGNLMHALLGGAAHEQEVVTALKDQVRAGETRRLILPIFIVTIFQPIAEEILFRGYFYAVFKGWAGALASAVFTSILFATVHGNLTALPTLLGLALMLTLAYEWSGSLKLPIAMHMLFNGINVAVMAQAITQAPSP